MQQSISNILNRPTNEITIEELIYCAEIVKQNGHVFFLKLDGERKERHYTVCITFPDTKMELIRADELSLKDALLKVLGEYVSRI